MRQAASYWINKLDLVRHREGGWFLETYRSPLQIPFSNLPVSFKDSTSVCTCIYFLLEKCEFSAFHRIASDEIWHFYEGDALRIYELESNGTLKEHSLGRDPENGESFQTTAKAGNSVAASLTGQDYALVGCTVAPGFNYADFELAERKELLRRWPQHVQMINSLTR